MAFSDFSLGQLQQQREGINRASTANYFNAIQMAEQMKARDEQAAQQYFANQQALKDRAERQRQNAFNIALQEKKDRLAIAQHEKDQAAQFRMKQMEVDSFAARNKSAEDIAEAKRKSEEEKYFSGVEQNKALIKRMAPQMVSDLKLYQSQFDAKLNRLKEYNSAIAPYKNADDIPASVKRTYADIAITQAEAGHLQRQIDNVYKRAESLGIRLNPSDGSWFDYETGDSGFPPALPPKQSQQSMPKLSALSDEDDYFGSSKYTDNFRAPQAQVKLPQIPVSVPASNSIQMNIGGVDYSIPRTGADANEDVARFVNELNAKKRAAVTPQPLTMPEVQTNLPTVSNVTTSSNGFKVVKYYPTTAK